MSKTEYTTTNSRDLYDLSMVRKMCRGNEGQIEKLVGVFVRQVSQSVDQIYLAMEEQDMKRIKSEIHKVKSTLRYYGAINVEKELLYVEQLVLREASKTELLNSIYALERVAKQTIMKINNDLKNI